MKRSPFKKIGRTTAAIALLAASPLAAFEVKPVILPIGCEVTVTLRAENDAEKKILAETPLYALSDQGTWSDGRFHGKTRWRPEWEKITLKRSGDTATFRIELPGPHEGWHTFRFGEPDKKWNFDPGKTSEFMLYRLKPDLFKLRPWKGDIHQHSVRCGHAKLEPKVIPAYNRLVGMDFMALSEHWRQAPSVEAIEAAKPWKCGLVLFTGEEFHTNNAFALHSVAVGHSFGINAWQKAHPEEFERRVDEELKKPVYRQYGMEPGLQRHAAMSMVLYRIAREQGAKVIAYSHPTGMIPGINVEAPSQSFRFFMLDNADYDALELPNIDTGSFHPRVDSIDRLMLMNAHVMELIHRRGKLIPMVAASDCHDQRKKWFGSAVTVFFAEKCDVDSFAAAVKDRRTLALRDARKHTYLIFGASRLIKFQQFLEKCYWPEHDRLCRRQGELLLRLVTEDDRSVLPEIERLAKAIDDYRESSYATAR